jgi:hypothetical protein
VHGTVVLTRQTASYWTESADVSTMTNFDGPVRGAVVTVKWLDRYNDVIGSFKTARTDELGRVSFVRPKPARAVYARAEFARTWAYKSSYGSARHL